MRDIPALGHSWGAWKTTKAATCTKAGTQTRTCSRCGDKETKSIAATGHSYEWKTTKQATCGADGSRQQVCKVCGAKGKTETVKATGKHTYEWLVTKKATCGENGFRRQVCSVCGAKGTTEKIPATGKHTYEWKVTKKATCGKDGEKQQVCKVCGAKGTTEKIPATGKHTYEWKVTKKATCSKDGTKQQVCSVCGVKGKTETIPATGKHIWKNWQVTKAATCEKKSEESRACAVCNKTETRAVPALGHDWDAGVMTKEPGYLNPGETTYTCARCGATKTEEIIPKEFPDSLKDPGNISLMNLDVPLMIVTQPEGGSIDPDGSMQLSVEVAGGEEPYTYQWRMRRNGWWSFWLDVENGTDSTVEAKNGNYKYYCNVYDNQGDHKVSDTVLVGWNLYIDKQPENQNLYGKDSVTLSCTANGGVPFENGEYQYDWYDTSGNPVGSSKDGKTEVFQSGTFRCWVTDQEGKTVTSQPCTVYSALPLVVKAYSNRPEDNQVGILGIIEGGVEPYTATWSVDGKDLGEADLTFDGAVYKSNYLVYDNGTLPSNYGTYTISVTDDMGTTETASAKLQLYIIHQPQSDMLPAEGDYTIDIEMGEGTLPITYTLYHNGEAVNTVTHDSLRSNQHTFDSGEYYYHVEDAVGRWADSDVAVVTDFKFQIDHIDVSGELTGPDDAVTLTAVTSAPAVRYRWSFQGEQNGVVITDMSVAEGTDASYTAKVPGQYKCTAYDAEGHIDSKSVRVTYDGTEPLPPIIIHQPQSVIAEYNENSKNVSASFTCLAVTWDGSTDLTYQWQTKSPKNGEWVNRWKVQRYVSDFSIGTAVRCVVTDNRTGEQTISDEAFVKIKLLVSEAKIYSLDHDGKRYDYQLIWKGGALPVTLEVYAKIPVNANDVRNSYLVYRGVYNESFKVWGVNVWPRWQKLPRVGNDGVYELVDREITYHYVLTDADGDKVEGDFSF